MRVGFKNLCVGCVYIFFNKSSEKPAVLNILLLDTLVVRKLILFKLRYLSIYGLTGATNLSLLGFNKDQPSIDI